MVSHPADLIGWLAIKYMRRGTARDQVIVSVLIRSGEVGSRFGKQYPFLLWRPDGMSVLGLIVN